MRIKLFAAVALAFASASLSAQGIEGTWSGTVHKDKDHHFVIDISSNGKGTYFASAHVDVRGYDLPINMVEIKDNQVTLTSYSVGFQYIATLSADGKTLSGTLHQEAAFPMELHRISQAEAWPSDTTYHTVTMVPVDKENNVQVELLDWRGSGPPLILLAGVGSNAHVFDDFAPKLTSKFHVYGITRRGFAPSTILPAKLENYASDILGNDVLAVMAWLKINRPFIAGHSIAGEELSSIGTSSPEKVRGLIYLEAGYPYAFFDEKHPDFIMSLNELKRTLNDMRVNTPAGEIVRSLKQLQKTDLPLFETAMQERLKQFADIPPVEGATLVLPPPTPYEAIVDGERKYGAVKCPVLYFFAAPHDVASRPKDPKVRAEAEANDLKMVDTQIAAIKAANPKAKIVKIAGANHFIYRSNEAEVIKEIEAFAATVK